MFTVSGKIAYTNNQFYYQITSNYYQASLPYELTENNHFKVKQATNCMNDAQNTIEI